MEGKEDKMPSDIKNRSSLLILLPKVDTIKAIIQVQSNIDASNEFVVEATTCNQWNERKAFYKLGTPLWVSLHQSFGLICWCDDEELEKEFLNLNNVNFLCLGNLITEEKVSALFRRLGISSLSEFRNLLDDSLIVMRKEAVGNGIVNVYTRKVPNLFVSAEQSFFSLPCFKENPAKGVSVFMSFVPLGGEAEVVSSLYKLRFIPLVDGTYASIQDDSIWNMMLDDCVSPGSTVTGYDSQELWHLLSHVSSKREREKCESLK
ncbi:hypothetical protein Tco_0888605, partial [Tanacetum coccineum]